MDLGVITQQEKTDVKGCQVGSPVFFIEAKLSLNIRSSIRSPLSSRKYIITKEIFS